MEHLDPGNTSGHSPVQFFLVAVLFSLMLVLHHLLVKTTSVRLAMMTWHPGVTHSFLMILFGMAKTVEQALHLSVPSTTPPGSASSCLRPQLMTSRFVFVLTNSLLRRTLQYNLLNSTFVDKLNSCIGGASAIGSITELGTVICSVVNITCGACCNCFTFHPYYNNHCEITCMYISFVESTVNLKYSLIQHSANLDAVS